MDTDLRKCENECIKSFRKYCKAARSNFIYNNNLRKKYPIPFDNPLKEKVPKEESMKNADLWEKSMLTFHLIDYGNNQSSFNRPMGIMSLSYDITRDWSEEEVKQYQLLAAAINRTFPKLKCYITGGTYVLKSKN